MKIGYRLFDDVQRPSSELIDRIRSYRSCDLSDAMNRTQTMIGIRPIYTPMERVVGPAVTVNSVVPSIDAGKMALATSRPGDVLVSRHPSRQVMPSGEGTLRLVPSREESPGS